MLRHLLLRRLPHPVALDVQDALRATWTEPHRPFER
jgi:hypothetical protein